MSISNILYVDDSHSHRILGVHNFRKITPDVDTARSYATALPMIRGKMYDLIILDGLEGDCFRLYDDIQNIPHGEVVIFSLNYDVRTRARRRGIPFYSKDEKEKLLEHYKS